MKIIFFCFCLFNLIGCVNNRSLEIEASYLDWTPYCFKGFDKRAEELASGTFQNCGFFSSVDKRYGTDEFFHFLSNGLTCVEEAFQKKQPFLFGIHSIWKDTYICEAYIYSNTGKLFRMFLDFDTSSGGDSSGKESWYFEEVCESIEIIEKIAISHYLNHIVDYGCSLYEVKSE